MLLAIVMLSAMAIIPVHAADENGKIGMERTLIQSNVSSLTFTFEGCDVDGSRDWISLYTKETWEKGNTGNYLDWQWCDVKSSGKVLFPTNDSTRMKHPEIWARYGTLADGKYVAALFSNGGYTVVDYIEFEVYSPIYAEKDAFAYGEFFKFNVRYAEGDTVAVNDWIGIYTADDEDYSNGFIDYAYLRDDYEFPSYQPTRLNEPLPIGNYKAVFLKDNGYEAFAGAPFYFRVEPKFSTDSSTIYVGDSFDLYCGTGIEQDLAWIGVYAKGTTHPYYDWVYAPQKEGTYTFPSANKSNDWTSTPGEHHIYYLDQKNTKYPSPYTITVTDQPAVLNGETLTVYKSSGFDLATIEAPEKEGCIFTGWADENGEYPESTYVTCKAGTVYTATYEEFVAEEKAPVKGAQIRLTTGSADLRYVSSIDKALLTSLGITEFYGENVKFGTLMLPLDRLSDGEELTKDTADVGIIPAVKKIEETDAEITFTACLINIYKQNYDRVFAVRPYIEYTDGNGVAHTIYGQTYGSAEEGASLYKVALELKAEMGDEAPEVVNNIISAVETAE